MEKFLDMVVFKVVNLGVVLEDFMQWYFYEKEFYFVDFGEGYFFGFIE